MYSVINERIYMQYKETGKKVNKDTAKNSQDYELRGISLKRMVYVKSRQHKFALVVTYSVLLTIYLFLPFLPGELMSLLGV